jgi:diaminopimelate epimerase
VRFLKGHGTENDFVLLPDPDGTLELTPGLVRAVCHRRAGIGADGVIRVVREAGQAGQAGRWFMDYWNSDGSLSEMCGNGIRVFARYLADHQGVPTDRPLEVGTRDGVKTLSFEPDGRITVDMGAPRLLGETKIGVGDRTWPATRVSTGNPHAVVFVDDLAEAGTLAEAPMYDPDDFPEGVNVEFVVRRGERHVAMRVHERGSGETRSCGTGACAVMVAAAARHFPAGQRTISDGSANHFGRVDGVTYRVDVPGGRLEVTWTGDDRVLLTGPAVLVAEGDLRIATEEG